MGIVGTAHSAQQAVRRRLTRAVAASPEAGMTTAEYAVGTVAACGFGAVLYKLLTSEGIQRMLRDILERALTVAF